MKTDYYFPAGKWKVGKYESPSHPDDFTGAFHLLLDEDSGNIHHSAIVINCDDRAFVDRLLNYLNS